MKTLWQDLRYGFRSLLKSPAYEQALYGEAEQLYLAALKETEHFEDEDGRLATSLSKLAALYFTQGKYAQLELLYQRVLAIRERAFGVHHPSVVQTLESYADLLWKQNRETEAKKLRLAHPLKGLAS